MEIKGWVKTSLIDYPGRICSVIFLPGCNFRCPFCQNPDLVESPEDLPEIPLEEVLEYLEQKKIWIDGVCITGGEPTIHRDLPELIKRLKEIGMLVKLDTNGSNPEMLEFLLNQRLLDYIAMDVKAPWEKYPLVAGVQINVEKIKKSIEIIRNSGIEHEFRTTLIPKLHSKEDIIKIGEILKGSKKFAIQQFRPRKTLNPEFQEEKPYSEDELRGFGKLLEGFFEKVEVRV